MRNKITIMLMTLMLCMGVLHTTALAEELDETADMPEYVDEVEVSTDAFAESETETAETADDEQSVGDPDDGDADDEDLNDEEPDFPIGTGFRPFTPPGTGTVIDNAIDGDGKEFYTISTPDDNVFYLIIDRQRSTENVYFLNAVTEQDLISLAAENDKVITGRPNTGTATSQPGQSGEDDEQSDQEEDDDSSGSNIVLYLVIIAAVGVGVAAYYFKVVKGKKNAAPDDDYYDDDDNGGGDDGYDDEDDDYGSDPQGNGDDYGYEPDGGDERE